MKNILLVLVLILTLALSGCDGGNEAYPPLSNRDEFNEFNDYYEVENIIIDDITLECYAYNFNNYEVRHNALKKIANKSPKEFDKLLTKLSQGKKVKLTVTITRDMDIDDGYLSDGESQAYRMYGI